jgi:hypothetical protein
VKKKTKQKKAKKPAKRGPKPDILKLEGNWKDAVQKSLSKKKPPEGWPE